MDGATVMAGVKSATTPDVMSGVEGGRLYLLSAA